MDDACGKLCDFDKDDEFCGTSQFTMYWRAILKYILVTLALFMGYIRPPSLPSLELSSAPSA